MSNKKFKSKPIQAKPVKQKREPSIRLRTLLSSLFNNNSAYEGGRRDKWWMAVLLFVVSIIVAVVPVMSQVSKTKGEDFYKGRSYNLDVALVDFGQKLVEKNIDITVVENSEYGKSFSSPNFASEFVDTLELTDKVSTVQIPYYSFAQDRSITVVVNGFAETQTVSFEYLRVYYTGHTIETFTMNGSPATPADVFLANYLATLTTKENVTTHYIFGQTSIYQRLYNPNKVTKGADYVQGINGLASVLETGLNIKTFATTGVNNELLNVSDVDYYDHYIKNWEAMINVAYEPIKAQLFWIQTGINAGIFTIIGLMMGLIIFISTRGKQNPHSYLKFGEAMKVGAWLLPTPALLTLIVGFLLPQYFTLIFVMGLGMRSVWLTMRTLRPDVPPSK